MIDKNVHILKSLHKIAETLTLSPRVLNFDSLILKFEEALSQFDKQDPSIAIQEHFILLATLKQDIEQTVCHCEMQVCSTIAILSMHGPIDSINEEYLNSSIKRLVTAYTNSNRRHVSIIMKHLSIEAGIMIDGQEFRDIIKSYIDNKSL